MIHMTKLSGVDDGVYHTHKIVKSLFPGTGRVLFFNSYGRVRVISECPPVGDTAYDGNSYVASKVELASPANGETVPFKVLFNPTKNVKQGGGKKSRCEGIIDQEAAKAWLARELSKGGAKVLVSSVDPMGVTKFEKDGKGSVTVAQHFAVGALMVEDAEAFCKLLLSGIGGAKFAGYGMVDVW